MTVPVAYAMSPRISDATARPTSSGCPHRAVGHEPFGDALVVHLLDAGGHVGGDDAGPHLVHRNPSGARRTANNFAAIDRPALLTQYSPRCGDAISAETDVTNTIARGSALAGLLLNEQPRDRLRQKVRALQIGAQHLFEALFGGGEQIGSHARRAAGVVHERVQRSEMRDDRREQLRPVVRRCRCRPASTRRRRPARRARSTHVRNLFARAQAAQRERPPVARERACDAQPDAARAAGHERDARRALSSCVALHLHVFHRRTSSTDAPSAMRFT